MSIPQMLTMVFPNRVCNGWNILQGNGYAFSAKAVFVFRVYSCVVRRKGAFARAEKPEYLD
jgi:hypothetical protein